MLTRRCGRKFRRPFAPGRRIRYAGYISPRSLATLVTMAASTSRPGTYVVPPRFGISAILALTTLFAFVFAILKGFEAHPVTYLFFGTLGVTICLAQMFFGKVPRVSSIVAGALLLPFWVFVTGLSSNSSRMAVPVFEITIGIGPVTLFFAAVIGAIVGYLTGTVM